MLLPRFMRHSLLLLGFLVIAAGAPSQASEKEYQPQEGQPGRDVMWIPTCQALVDKMLDMAKVTAEDYVIDLGSGDGRLVITAARRGARALGIEYNANMVALSKRTAAEEGVGDRAQFTKADIFESDFSQATVITLFLLDELNLQLRPQLLNLKPGTRIVSNTFTMGDWKADQTVALTEKECREYSEALLWIVPAKVEGTWKIPRKGELRIRQSFQMFSGTLKSGNRVTLVYGKLNGDLITFLVEKTVYTGRVNGGTIEGTVQSGGSAAKWTATQVPSKPQ
jgi:hypothetical protein